MSKPLFHKNHKAQKENTKKVNKKKRLLFFFITFFLTLIIGFIIISAITSTNKISVPIITQQQTTDENQNQNSTQTPPPTKQELLVKVREVFPNELPEDLPTSNLLIVEDTNGDLYISFITREEIQTIMQAKCYKLDQNENITKVSEYQHRPNVSTFATRENFSPYTCNLKEVIELQGTLDCLKEKPEIKYTDNQCQLGIKQKDTQSYYFLKNPNILDLYEIDREDREAEFNFSVYLYPNPSINPYITEGVAEIISVIRNQNEGDEENENVEPDDETGIQEQNTDTQNTSNNEEMNIQKP